MKKTLSIIVPVYNEINTIKVVIQRLKKLTLYKNLKKEILIVDDFSTDGTIEYLKKIKKKSINFKFIFKKKNKGKGHSQKLCKNLTKGDFVAIHDADLEYDPNDLNKLLKIAIDHDKEFVIGYRDLSIDFKHLYFILRETVVKSISLFTSILYNQHIKDVSCCHRLFSKRVWKNISPKGNRFDYDYSIICKALLITKKVGQCKIRYKSRSYDDGKKNSWYVAIQAIIRITLDRIIN